MLTTEELEHTLGEALRLNQATSLRFDEPTLGRLSLDIEELSGASLIHTQVASEKRPLLIPITVPKPVVVMYFQVHGGVKFSLNDSVRMPERHHSLCCLPGYRLNYDVGENTSFQDLAIRFKPDVLAAQLQEEGAADDDWQRLLEGGDEPFATLRASQRISPRMQGTLHQLLHCPYNGKFGRTYKDALIRLLLVEQLVAFRQDRQATSVLDAKLTRRDVETLHELRTHLEAHYLEDLSLDKIAREFGLNTFKLKYGFRKLFDTSVMRFVDDARMAHARRLLLDGGHEPFDVAEQIGYAHYANFSAAFKRKFGQSPSQLRAPVGTDLMAATH